LSAAAIAAALQPDRHARVVAVSAVITILGAIPIAFLTTAIMKGAGYATVPTSPPLAVASLSSVPGHISLLASGLNDLFNAYLGPAFPGTLHAEVGAACEATLLAALAAVLYFGLRSGAELARRRHEHVPPDLARNLHVAYWFSSALIVCAAFVFTTAPGFGGLKHESYYLTVIFSVAAIVPLFIGSSSWLRLLVPLGVAVFAVGSVIGLKRNYVDTLQSPISQFTASIVDLAHRSGAVIGYSGYWDANGLTWNTDDRVQVHPLVQCPNPRGADICPFPLMRTPSWYVPRQRRTFLLVDPGQLFVTTLPRGLGPPIAHYRIGTIAMYVYPYDIASRLGPPQ
jgi:hypothetical protein